MGNEDTDRRELTAEECERYGCRPETTATAEAIETLRQEWQSGTVGAWYADAMSEANRVGIRTKPSL